MKLFLGRFLSSQLINLSKVPNKAQHILRETLRLFLPGVRIASLGCQHRGSSFQRTCRSKMGVVAVLAVVSSPEWMALMIARV